jgi:hypothetical protein
MKATRHGWLVLSAMTAILGATITTTARTAVDSSDAVAIWLFDESDGAAVLDATDNGNSGEFVNDVQRADGQFGGALSFDGDTAYVEMNNPVVVDTADFSMGCWVMPAATQKAFANILSSHEEPPQRGMSFEQDNQETNLHYLIGGDGAVWMGWVTGNLKTQLEGDVWQHFVAVREGTTLTHYLNGEPNGDSDVGGETLKAATSNFRIGNWVLGAREWSGVIDEAFIFNRALQGDEIRTAMADGIAGGVDVSPVGSMATTWATIKARNDP